MALTNWTNIVLEVKVREITVLNGSEKTLSCFAFRTGEDSTFFVKQSLRGEGQQCDQIKSQI
jgi:hypothetical protein